MDVVKLGGSVVTHRQTSCAVHDEHVGRLAGEIGPHAGGLVLIHGGGSFRDAVMPLLDRPRGISDDQGLAAQRAQEVLRDLQARIGAVFLRAGIRVVALDPSSLFAFDNGEVVAGDLELLRFLASHDRVPLLSPGLVPEAAGGWTVLSTDTIAAEAALAIGAGRVVWATDVDGVIGRGGDGTEVVLEHLAAGERLRVARRSADADDPTGGMGKKLEEAFRLAERGIGSIVVNGTRSGYVRRALDGDPTVGTVISPKRA